MTFDDILADCIEALEQGATLQECLTRYPAHATALEPYLHLVVSLSAESQTRLSAPAFQRGRQLLSAQAQQRRAHHRQPVYPAVSATRPMRPAAYPPNGVPHRRPHRRRPVADKRAWWSLGLPRLLRTALLLVIFLGATTFFRQVMTSLPGTTFYSVKSSGEQLVGVLMEAAGEGVPWHTAQAERRLQELAQLADSDVMTVQTLAQGVEMHWEAMLVASEGLPAAERDALLAAQISRLQQLEATWTTGQLDISPPAVATVRKLITASEAALAGPAPTEKQTETVATVTTTATPTVTAMPSSTLTPTPLLQASATVATVVPVLVPSSTPTASPTLAAPTVEEVLPTVEPPSPTEVVSEPPVTTPLPEITVQMPQQESNTQQEDEDHSDNDNAAEAATVTPTPSPELPTEVTPLPTTTATVADTDGTVTTEPIDDPATVVAPLTPVSTEVQPPPVPTTQTPQVSSTVENTPAVPTKTAPGATSTAVPTVEAQATGTPRPTNQATATRTPKPTATHANASTATPDAANNPTAAPPTAVENTPAPTSQPTTPPRDEALQTPSSASVTPVLSQPIKPRPTTPSGEPTKGIQP